MAFTRKSKEDTAADGDTTAEPSAEKPAAKQPAESTQEPAKAAEPAKESKPAKESTRLDRGAKDKKNPVVAGANALRSRIASVIWLVAVVFALFLAVGALLVALGANKDNGIVSFILDTAKALDGPFSRENGLFTFDGKSADTKSALVNWGLGAVAYLLVGKILDRVIRP